MFWIQQDNAPPPGTRICYLKDLPNGKGREFSFGEKGYPFSMFIVRKEDLIRAYINECPHIGVQLNWSPDDFTNEDGDLIVCSTHGALFEIENGYCSFGPCTGDYLKQIPLEIIGDEVRIANRSGR